MLDKYFESPFTLKQLRSGPSGAWIDSFAGFLHDGSYSWWTSRAYLRGAHHFGHFLESKNIALVAARLSHIEDFRRHLKRCRCSKPVGGTADDAVRGAKIFLRHLWAICVVPPPEKHRRHEIAEAQRPAIEAASLDYGSKWRLVTHLLGLGRQGTNAFGLLQRALILGLAHRRLTRIDFTGPLRPALAHHSPRCCPIKEGCYEVLQDE